MHQFLVPASTVTAMTEELSDLTSRLFVITSLEVLVHPELEAYVLISGDAFEKRKKEYVKMLPRFSMLVHDFSLKKRSCQGCALRLDFETNYSYIWMTFHIVSKISRKVGRARESNVRGYLEKWENSFSREIPTITPLLFYALKNMWILLDPSGLHVTLCDWWPRKL